jgi:hypothetical protein
MGPIIEEHRDELADLCRRHHVRRLFVFGSAARDDFDPARSDVDLLVEFGPVPEGGYADAYFSLREALEALLGREVDLVAASALRNPYIKADIERTRSLLYAA